MSVNNNSKIIRELVAEIRDTPGFMCSQEGAHMKVHGPDGRTTTIKVGLGSRKGKDDYDIRRQLRNFVGWPPTTVGRALHKATASDPAPDLVLPGLTLVPKTAPPTKAKAKPMTAFEKPPTPLPAPAAVNTSRQRAAYPAPVSWTQAVYLHLQRFAGAELDFEQIIQAVPPRDHGMATSSASPILSSRWLDAQEGDVYLCVARRRVARGFVYWFTESPRRPERRDDSKRGEEPKPVIPEPKPEPPLVIPEREPDRPVVPEPEDPPNLFERIGEIRSGELLLSDEHGDIWTAQRARFVRVMEQDLIRDDRGGLWRKPESE